MPKKEKMYLITYVSKHNSYCKKQVVPLLIPNEEGWHYLAVKKLSALPREITSKNNDDFCCLNYLNFFRTKTRPESYMGVCANIPYKNM